MRKTVSLLRNEREQTLVLYPAAPAFMPHTHTHTLSIESVMTFTLTHRDTGRSVCRSAGTGPYNGCYSQTVCLSSWCDETKPALLWRVSFLRSWWSWCFTLSNLRDETEHFNKLQWLLSICVWSSDVLWTSPVIICVWISNRSAGLHQNRQSLASSQLIAVHMIHTNDKKKKVIVRVFVFMNFACL